MMAKADRPLVVEGKRDKQLLNLIDIYLKRLGFKNDISSFEHTVVGTISNHSRQFVFSLSSQTLNEVYSEANDRDLILFLIQDDASTLVPSLTQNDLSRSLLQAILFPTEEYRSQTLRMGRDILFSGITQEAIRNYYDYLSNIAKNSFHPTMSLDSSFEINEWVEEEYEQKRINDRNNITLDEVREEITKSKRTLLAIDDIEEPTNIIAGLALKQCGELSEGDHAQFCLPLFLFGHQIRAQSLLNAVSNELFRAYGVLLDIGILRKVLSLGYIHLYITGVECWRIGSDLDPNTVHFAELLAVTGEEGRFLIGCCREDVVQYLSYIKSPLNPVFRTLGDRFRRDPSISLVNLRKIDIREESEDSFPQDIDNFFEERIEYFAKYISDIAQNLVTPAEVIRLLEYIAIRAMSHGGHAIRQNDLTAIIRRVVVGNRGRVNNIAKIESSLLICGVLHLQDSNTVTFISEAFHTWLIFRLLYISLVVFLESGRRDLLSQLLLEPGLKWWTLDRGISKAWEKGGKNPLNHLLILLKKFNFFGSQERSDADTAERLNLLRIYQFCLSKYNKGDESEVFINDLEKLSWQFNNLPMCQFYFDELPMNGWIFDECDLRNSVFKNCQLGTYMAKTSFKDCFLGGAIFDNCEFRDDTSFIQSDLSGAIIKGSFPRDFSKITNEGCLSRVNLTAAEILIAKGREELEKRLIQNLGELVNTNIIAKDDPNDDLSVPLDLLSDEYVLACARCRWNDSGAVITPVGRLLYKAKDAVRELATGWTGEIPKLLKVIEFANGHDLLLAESPDLGLIIALAGGTWSTVPESIIAKSTYTLLSVSTNHDACVFIARCAPSGPLEVRKISFIKDHLDISLICRKDFQGGFCATSIHWMDHKNLSEAVKILVGGEGGDIYSYSFDGDMISERIPFRSIQGVPVVEMASTPDQDIVYVAGGDNIVQGYRFHSNASPLPLFTFQTGHRCINGLEVRPNSGQVFVSGPGKGTKSKDKESTPLFFLANTRGDILGVWPDNRVLPSSGSMLHSRNSHSSIIPSSDKPSLGFSESIESFNLHPGNTILYNPVFDEEITLDLRSDQNVDIPSVTIDAENICYRICEATFLDSRTGTLIDADFKISEGPSALKLTFRPNLPSGVETAIMDLRIKFFGPHIKGAAENSSKGIKRIIEIQQKHDNNPYIPDGRPATGQKFFGLEPALNTCIKMIVNDRSLIGITAPRRSGKTSFLYQLEHRLVHEYNRVCVVVSGESMDSEETFFSSIYAALVEFEKSWQNFRGITRETNPSHRYEMLEIVAKAIRRRGTDEKGAVLIILVDEWGLVRKRALDATALNGFTGKYLPNLMEFGVCFCLSSVPRDFEMPSGSHHSDNWRNIRWMQIGKLTNDDAKKLISVPLDNLLSMKWTKGIIDWVIKYTSCAPDDLNRVMYHAVQRAEQDFIENPKKPRVLLREHFEGFEAMLIPKYERMRSYTYDKFDRKDKDWLLANAQENPPIWDKVPLHSGGEMLSAVQPDGSRIKYNAELIGSLMEDGFRQPIDDSDQGTFSAGFKLWVPWGLTLWLQSQAKKEGI